LADDYLTRKGEFAESIWHGLGGATAEAIWVLAAAFTDPADNRDAALSKRNPRTQSSSNICE